MLFSETTVLGHIPVIATIGRLTVVRDKRAFLVVDRGVTVLAVCDRRENAISFATGVKQ